MANKTLWTPGGSTGATILSTDLNSLGSGSISTPTEGGATYDNTSSLDLYHHFELVLASLTPTGSPYCLLYFLATLDGTNYPSPLTSHTGAIVAVFQLDTATAAKRVAVYNKLLPNLKGKFCLLNSSGVSLASSGNTVKLTTGNFNNNG